MEKTLYPAGALSFGAALIHLWEAPEHFEQWWVYGVFLLATSLVLGLYGVALLRWPGRLLVSIGLWANLGLVVGSYALIRAGAVAGTHGGWHGEVLGVLALLCSATAAALLSGVLWGPERMLHAAEALSLLAALVHLWEFSEHLERWWGFGAFFMAACIAQGLYSLALPYLWRRPLFLALGIAGNVSIVALWLFTRTAGIPYVRTIGVRAFELRTGMVEGVEAADIVATASEVMLVAVLVLLMAGLYRSGEVRSGGRLPRGRGAGLNPT